MFKNFIIFSLALIVFSCNVEDTSSPDPDDVFIKYFGVSGQQHAVSVVFNESKNQFFILASQDLEDGEAMNFYYIVADAGGNLLYSDIVDFKDSNNESLIDEPVNLKILDDNRYLVVGTSTNSEEESHIVWGTITHDLETQQYHEVENPTAPFDLMASDIIPTNSGTNVLLLGTTSRQYSGDLADPSTAGKQYFLSKRNATNSDVVWNKSLGVVGDDIGLAVFELQDGAFALFGSTESDSEGTRVNVVLTNSFGTVDGSGEAFGVQIEEAHDDVPSSVIEVGGNFKVVGTTTFADGRQNAFVMGVSKYGNLDTTPTEPQPLQSDFGSISSRGLALARTLDGGYLVMGSYPSFQIISTETGQSESRLEEMMVMRIDADDTKVEGLDQYYGLESGNDQANSAIMLPGGKVAVVGTFDFGSGTTLVGLLKLNSRGELKF